MVKGYYYLIASLPFLSLEKELRISKEQFLLECEKWLSEKDMDILLNSVVFEDDIDFEKDDMLSIWKAFDAFLRKQLARYRENTKEGLKSSVTDKTIKEIVEQQDPLKKEKVLAEKKLEILDDLEQGHVFDLEAVIIYYLKLVIIERIKKFDEEKGLQVFETLCEVKYE
ncbi:MAG: DUF2764 family protein [Candidatus Omnitrophica bacterium]|nr:DUF2764 family protein [Candidatus Omnitrophota bacterium]